MGARPQRARHWWLHHRQVRGTSCETAPTYRQAQPEREIQSRKGQSKERLQVFRDGDPVVITETEIAAERKRRREIAALRNELHGDKMPGSYAQDPEWDDVVPILAEEPEGALAAISYPSDYAEGVSPFRLLAHSSPRVQKTDGKGQQFLISVP